MIETWRISRHFDDESRHRSDSFYQRDLFEALRFLMPSGWWNRIWVVQEVVVPKILTLLYGSMTAPWNMIVNAATSYSLNQLVSKTTTFPKEYPSVLASFSRIVLGIHDMRGRWLHGEQTSLLSQLGRFSHRKATDDRDKVYALLGLIQGPPTANQVKILPDYSLDTVTVFRNTVLSIVETTGSLIVLIGDIGRKNRQDLPSWLPDWSATYDDLDHLRGEDTEHYNVTASVSIFAESPKEEEYSGTLRSIPCAGAPKGQRLGSQCSDQKAYSKILDPPDWERHISNPYGRIGEAECLQGVTKYLAAERDTVWLRDHSGILEYPGIREGRVVVVEDTCFSREDLVWVVQSWASHVYQLFEPHGPPVFDIRKEFGCSFLRTLCADIIYTNALVGGSTRHRVTDDHLGNIAAQIELWIKEAHQPPAPRQNHSPYLFSWDSLVKKIVASDLAESQESCVNVDVAVRTAILRRRLFITDTGHMGLRPSGPQLDDELCLLLGARTLLILRQSASSISPSVGGKAPKDSIQLRGF